MRRLPLLLASAALALTLTACGGAKAPTSNQPGNGSQVIFSTGASGVATSDQPSVATNAPATIETAGLRLDDLAFTPVDPSGVTTFSGVVINGGAGEAQVARIVIELYDGAGQRVSRVSFSNPPLAILQPGDSSRWQAQAGNLLGEWQTAKATVEVAPPAAAR